MEKHINRFTSLSSTSHVYVIYVHHGKSQNKWEKLVTSDTFDDQTCIR